MNNSTVFVIGLMSGTSLDGIDLVYVRFDKNKYQDFEILASETVSYSEEWKTTLQDAINFSSDALRGLNLTYGKLLGEVLNSFIDKFHIKDIDFIASHGHTVLHQPKKGITLQVGDGQVIANSTAQKVICDFRTQDVKLGGQGAPLVPIGDELLFSNYDYCLNLGGFSNISFHKDAKRIAYDICPVNIVLNFYANKLGLEYDESGNIAAKGKINNALLNALNALPFYKKAPPKSLGLEWVKENVFPLIDSLESDVPTVLRTFVTHISLKISEVIINNDSVLITGGGVFNTFLIAQIEFYANIKITLTSSKLINFKEALIFAFLGVLRADNKVNCLRSVTGASRNHSAGEVFYPN